MHKKLKEYWPIILQALTFLAVISQLYLQHYYVQRGEFEAFVAESRVVQSNLVAHTVWDQATTSQINSKDAEQDHAIGKLDDRVLGLETRIR